MGWNDTWYGDVLWEVVWNELNEYSASPFPIVQECLVPSPFLDMIHWGESCARLQG